MGGDGGGGSRERGEVKCNNNTNIIIHLYSAKYHTMCCNAQINILCHVHRLQHIIGNEWHTIVTD